MSKKIKRNIPKGKNIINPKKTDYTLYIILGAIALVVDIFLVLQYSNISVGNPEMNIFDKLAKLGEVENSDIISLVTNKEVMKCFFETQKTLALGYLIAFLFILIKIFEPKEEFKGIEHGSSDWAKKKDYKRFSNPENTIVLADNLYLDLDDSEADNLNEVVVGGSGAGKSWRKIKPDILQMIGSYVVTDPKGELYRDTCKVLESNGYKVKVLNLISPQCSNGYNPFKYIDEGRLDTDVPVLVNCFMKNTSDNKKGGGDQFWDDSMKSLLTGIVYYLMLNQEEEKSFERVLKLTTNFCVDEESGEIDESKTEIHRIFNKIRSEKPGHPGLIAYDTFLLASGKTAKSIVISLGTRLNIWISKDICALTYKDEMELEKVGTEKTAIFLVIPDTDDTFKVIASMFYTQLFKVLFNQADFVYNGRLPYLVSCELDEFANIGEIPGFDRYIAVMRSRNIRVAIVIQALSQLEKLYKDSWEIILGCCYVFNYLGTTDTKTQEYVNKRLGKTTILAKQRGTNRSSKSASTNENNNYIARELLTVAEIAKLDKTTSIVFVRGVSPFYVDKFRTQNHSLIRYVGSQYEKDYHNNTNIIERYSEISKLRIEQLEERRENKYKAEKRREEEEEDREIKQRDDVKEFFENSVS